MTDRSEAWTSQAIRSADFAVSRSSITEAITEEPVPLNAIWGGALDNLEVKTPLFDIPYDIQEVTTDELPPVLPILSMSTHEMNRETYPVKRRVKLVEYGE